MAAFVGFAPPPVGDAFGALEQDLVLDVDLEADVARVQVSEEERREREAALRLRDKAVARFASEVAEILGGFGGGSGDKLGVGLALLGLPAGADAADEGGT